MPSRTFDAVIFDMDGVLCDSEPFIAAAAAEALRRRYGIDVTREDFLPFVGAGDDRFITGAAALHGVTVDLAVDKALTYEIYLELIAVSLQPVAGVHAFLAEARAAGLRLAVATGSDRPKLNGNLAAIGVAESTFDVVISAEHVTHKKPDPETFLRAVERLGLPASRCLVVEDAPNGVRAGRAAGCAVLGITSSQPAEALLEEGAFAVAPDFTALPAEVRAALGLGPGPGCPRPDAPGQSSGAAPPVPGVRLLRPATVPGHDALELDLEREAEEGPDQHDDPEGGGALDRRVDGHRLDDVGDDQDLEAEQDRLPDLDPCPLVDALALAPRQGSAGRHQRAEGADRQDGDPGQLEGDDDELHRCLEGHALTSSFMPVESALGAVGRRAQRRV